MWRSMVVLLPALLLACGDKDEEEATSSSADCSDPGYNPFAGTCVENFHADCFDPQGECTGEFDMSSGGTNLEWANGAQVDVSINPATFGATTQLINSDGTVCATGESANNVGSCASQTVYTRASDGATQTWCIQLDGSMEVTCSDGGSVTVTSDQQQGASQCQYGGGEACTIEGLPEAY